MWKKDSKKNKAIQSKNKCFSGLRSEVRYDVVWLFLIVSLFFSAIGYAKPIELTADGKKFAAEFVQAHQNQAKGLIILLPDRFGKVTGTNVIKPLLDQLPRYAWAVLSIQLPEFPQKIISESELKQQQQQVNQRIDAALAYAKEKEFTTVYLLGYDTGAFHAYQFQEQKLKEQREQKDKKNKKNKIVSGLILVSYLRPELSDKKDYIIELISEVPILDIYAKHDYISVIADAVARQMLYQRAIDVDFRQYEMIAADHYYSKHEYLLLRRIRGWLHKQSIHIKKEEKET